MDRGGRGSIIAWNWYSNGVTFVIQGHGQTVLLRSRSIKTFHARSDYLNISGSHWLTVVKRLKVLANILLKKYDYFSWWKVKVMTQWNISKFFLYWKRKDIIARGWSLYMTDTSARVLSLLNHVNRSNFHQAFPDSRNHHIDARTLDQTWCFLAVYFGYSPFCLGAHTIQ